jgi:hypothetical protein
MVAPKKVSKALTDSPTSLRLVVYGQGTTDNRSPTLLRLSDRIREELGEVAQGQLYLVIEHALRRLIDDLKAMPAGQMTVINAADMSAEPARHKAPKRAPRAKKAAA